MNSQELYKYVIERFKAKQPTSIVRAGDGEAMFLDGFNDIETLKMVCKRQFGSVLQIDHVEEIQDNLIKAFKEADVLGIKLDPREGLGKYWVNTLPMIEERTGKIENLTTIDFHNEWLQEGKFNELLDGLDTLCYISCRDITEQLKAKYRINNIYSYIIAPEAKFTSGYKGMNHYPDQYYDIRRSLGGWDIKGNLCLVGAGIAGKIYNSWFKDKGGISLDIGNVFDLWAGKATRGPERGLDAIDNTFKL